MDDVLEQPTPNVAQANPDNSDSGSDSEDGGPDWTNLPRGISVGADSSATSRPFIPKRGDKEFEPAGQPGSGSSLQQHKLERVRNAMFSALDVQRTVSSKVVSHAIWIPEIARAHVIRVRGNHLNTMGHSYPRGRNPGVHEYDDSKFSNRIMRDKLWNRIELLPEEALYLIERGSMFCWKQEGNIPIGPNREEFEGTPMTVQNAYAEMIGREDLTLEKYQVC